MRTIALLDIDCFFASVEMALRPELLGRPVCVGGRRGERGIVACPNYEARRYGVRTAMPVRTAERLLPPDAVFLRGNHKLYGEYSDRVMTILEQFTPDVEQVSIDEAYMDVTGCLHLWGGGADGAVRMMSAIKQRVFRECGLSVSVGIASNKVCAKIAAGLRKPDGLVMVPAGSEREFLAPLPVEVIPGVGRKTLPRLQARGIMTVGDLLRRPGQATSALDRYLTAVAEGRDDRVVRSGAVDKSISRDTTFGHDTADRAFIGSMLYYLTECCCRTLRERAMAATTVTAKVRFADFTTLQKQTTLAAATDREEEVFALAQRLVDTVLPPGQMVRLVGLKVSGLVPREGAGCQMTLDTATEERLDRLHQRIDALRKKFGYASIQRGRTVMLQQTFARDEQGYETHSPVYEL
jgi:DNA polymerase IV